MTKTFIAPAFLDDNRNSFEETMRYRWWSWHPLYPYWSRSCWGGLTEEVAWESLLNPLAIKMRLYHNKLIRDDHGTLRVYRDLPPQTDPEKWLRSIQRIRGKE